MKNANREPSAMELLAEAMELCERADVRMIRYREAQKNGRTEAAGKLRMAVLQDALRASAKAKWAAARAEMAALALMREDS